MKCSVSALNNSSTLSNISAGTSSGSVVDHIAQDRKECCFPDNIFDLTILLYERFTQNKNGIFVSGLQLLHQCTAACSSGVITTQQPNGPNLLS